MSTEYDSYENTDNTENGQPSQNTGFVNGEYRYGRIPQEGPDYEPQGRQNAGYTGSYTNNGFYGSYGEPNTYQNGTYTDANGYRTTRYDDNTGYGAEQNRAAYGYAAYGNTAQAPAGGRKKKGTGRKVLAVALAVVMLSLAAVGGYFAAKALSDDPQTATAFSRDDMNSLGETKAADGEITAENKTGENKNTEGTWKLATKAATENSSAGMQLDVSSVAEVSLPAIVAITNTSVQEMQNYYSMWGFGYGDNGGGSQEVQSAGSGIIVGQSDTDLLIVTNHHVIEGADSLSVSFCDDSVYDATVKGSDAGVDVALIYVKLADLTEETKQNIAKISIGSSDALKIGQQVVAIGNALGQGQSVTTGIVSALNRTVSTSTAPLLQTDAAINPGNSGGALLNMSGELIGINSAKYASTDVEGMGYAIPIDTVIPIIERIQNKVQRSTVSDEDASYIGISGQDVTAYAAAMYGMPNGVYIAKVTENGPCEKAGIKAGSILTTFDDETVTTMAGLKELLTYYAAGETVTVVVSELEGNEYVSHEYQITLGSAKDMPANDTPSGQNGRGQQGQ